MRTPGAILLISCYELGHQPLSLASPIALLREAGYDPAAVDTSVSELLEEEIQSARLVAISVPMHTALRLGTRVAERVRAVNPAAHICFYGLYAALNAEYLLGRYGDSTIGGEYESTLLALARAIEAGDAAAVPGVRTRETHAAPVLAHLPFVTPVRESLPSARRYAHLLFGERAVPAGYVEASRGCLHTCRHCPITPVYGGRFFVVPREVVLADIRQQVRQGVRHITFGDPDFMNGPKHSMSILRAMHEEFPKVTFDATIKVEHILERRELFPELASLGCVFVVSAVESLGDDVLRRLKKDHRRADVSEALRILDGAAIPMRPTFVAFTPWTSAADYLDVLDFIAEHELVENVDPVQYTIRLLVPPGSALLEEAASSSWLGELDEAAFGYRWSHPDPRMDRLQREVAALVERTVALEQPVEETFAQVYALTEAMLGIHGCAREKAFSSSRPKRRPVARLSESWFCCAEPTSDQFEPLT
ncbi:MAG TPA: CUAEP/CCAEP-tail radical SAM protein, partial [Ktedonobacterales bacterium]|nr:CUAEP/CCAEP-tail radical SAM protein [Ktedonobacterales bacterium]